jgi:transposase
MSKQNKSRPAPAPQAIAHPDLFAPGAVPAAPEHLPVLGIDIAKATFRACLTGPSLTRSAEADFPNTPEGFTTLDAWLGRHGAPRTRAGLEATGHYSMALLEHLHAKGHHASLINPRWIKDYARSQGRRNKTDEVDARVIADYVRTHDLPAWQPAGEDQKTLRALLARREDIQRTKAAEERRLESRPAPAAAVFIKQTIAHCEGQLQAIEKAINAAVKESIKLSTAMENLCSIPSIGRITALKLLAGIPPVESFERVRDLAAWAGLTPSQCRSGTSLEKRPRMNKQGSATVRKAMYMPAVTLMKSRAENTLTRFRDRLLLAGKTKMSVIGALMRKLFQTACGILKHNTPFNPSLN